MPSLTLTKTKITECFWSKSLLNNSTKLLLHFSLVVHQFMDTNYPNNYIGCKIEWKIGKILKLVYEKKFANLWIMTQNKHLSIVLICTYLPKKQYIRMSCNVIDAMYQKRNFVVISSSQPFFNHTKLWILFKIYLPFINLGIINTR